jgi:hypothetical protein
MCFDRPAVVVNLIVRLGACMAYQVHVSTPAGGVLCVMKGAIAFSLDPDRAVFGRVARFSYGVRTLRPFRVEVDRAEKKFWNSAANAFYVRDAFAVLVRKGELLKENDVVNHVVSKKKSTSRDIRLTVHASTSDHPVYVDDAGCHQLAQLDIPMPNPASESANVAIRFGGTEIHVMAVDTLTSRRVETSIAFETSNLETRSAHQPQAARPVLVLQTRYVLKVRSVSTVAIRDRALELIRAHDPECSVLVTPDFDKGLHVLYTGHAERSFCMAARKSLMQLVGSSKQRCHPSSHVVVFLRSNCNIFSWLFLLRDMSCIYFHCRICLVYVCEFDL